MEQIVKYENIESKVLEVRGLKVIFDSDLAGLYGVETKRINEAAKNNLDKFPDGYIIELTQDPFIGMWRGRSNLVDSAKWVREMRRGEWER